jgi:hypothetical protein
MRNEPVGLSCYVTDNPADISPTQRALPLYTEPFPTDEDLLRVVPVAVAAFKEAL